MAVQAGPRPAIVDMIGQRFVRANAEAHRRRATRIDPPLVSLYVQIRRPPGFLSTYEPFLSGIMAAVNQHPKGSDDYAMARARGEELAASAFSHFNVNTDPTSEPQGDDEGANIHLTASFDDAVWARGRWRVEAHRDFVAITLFAGIDVQREADSLLITLKGRMKSNTRTLSGRIRMVNNRHAAPRLATQLFKVLPGILANRFDVIARSIQNPDSDPSPVSAMIYGVTVPWTLIDLVAIKPTQSFTEFNEDLFGGVFAAPVFPRVDTPGFPASEQSTGAARSRTNAYLTGMWSGLEGDGLLVSTKASDSIACYVMNGHGIYISSLGSTPPGKAPDKSPLKYLLLYQDQGIDRAERNGGMPTILTPTDRGIDGTLNYNFTWRLSRFIGRLHDLGATRLAALSDYQAITPFLQHLRDAECDLADLGDTPSLDKIGDIERTLIQQAFKGTRSMAKRASLARYYSRGIDRLLGDLGVISLPTFQSYDQFLRRRVMGTIDRMASATDRYEGFMRRLNSMKMSIQTGRILAIQEIADIVATLVFLWYSTEMALFAIGVSDYLVRGWFPPVASWADRLPAWMDPMREPHTLALVLGIAVTFGWFKPKSASLLRRYRADQPNKGR